MGLSQKEIAKQLGCYQSTISRELSGNRGRNEYISEDAQKKAERRKSLASRRPKKLTKELIGLIKSRLYKKFSPEQISGVLRKDNGIIISYETIYRMVWADKRMGGTLYKDLRRRGKRYNKRGSKVAGRGLIPNRRDISERPKIVEEKLRLGDFEGDTIIGKGHRSAIVTIVDRRTKLLKMHLVMNNNATDVGSGICKKLMPLKQFCYTITTDNGREFAHHQMVAKELGIDFFFARPYRSCERGLNENTNGLIRQYFPKGTDFSEVSHDEVYKVECALNNRPRKSLGYRTPREEFILLTGFDPI